MPNDDKIRRMAERLAIHARNNHGVLLLPAGIEHIIREELEPLLKVLKNIQRPLREAMPHLPHLAVSNEGEGRYDCGKEEHCFTHQLESLSKKLAEVLKEWGR